MTILTRVTSFLSLTLIVGLISSDQHFEKVHLCQLVEEHRFIDFTDPSQKRFDNGYLEERYDEVLDTVYEVFAPIIRQRGGYLRIVRDWSDGAVNAWAWRQGQQYGIEIPGGMARYSLINEEAFIATICHEIGHLLGGSPHHYSISVEGQADYYAPMKCMEKVFLALEYDEEDRSINNLDCSGIYCYERFRGIESLSSYYAELGRVPKPSLSTPSSYRTQRTLRSHPKPQCRFDTMIAALACSNRDDFSYEDPLTGSCQGIGKRPACWYFYKNLSSRANSTTPI